jgi:hypothetical protein
MAILQSDSLMLGVQPITCFNLIKIYYQSNNVMRVVETGME